LAAHQDAAWKFVLDAESNPSFEALLTELKRSDLPVAVISSESFELLYRRPATIGRIADGLESCGYEPRVLFYVRRQGSYAESLYAELVKHGLRQSFDEYVDRLIEDGVVTYYTRPYCFEYAHLADAFAEAFGPEGVVVRPYHPQRRDDNILRDFLTSIAGPNHGVSIPKAWRENRSLPYRDVLRKLYRNAPAKPVNAPDPDALVEATLGASEREFLDQPFAILNLDDEIRLFERFDAANLDLERRYGFQPPLIPESAQTGQTPQKRLMRSAAEAWRL
jgi:hypothetical protein